MVGFRDSGLRSGLGIRVGSGGYGLWLGFGVRDGGWV